MIGFIIFLLLVFAAGFIYLTFQSRWQVKETDTTTTLGASKVEHFDDSIKITADKINLNGTGIVNGTIHGVGLIDVNPVKTVTGLPKKAPRINQAHWQTRTFERPRRKVRR